MEALTISIISFYALGWATAVINTAQAILS